jgi:hypothetical protein
MKNELPFDIPVDIDSLSSFIEVSKNALKNQVTNNGYYRKVKENLTEASRLLFEIEKRENSYFFSDWFYLTESGTVYGKRFSLLSTELKEALLGKCSKIQIKESNFSVLASLAKIINPTLHIASLNDFIRHKSHICEQIAIDINVKKHIIEKVFSLLDLTTDVSDITTEFQTLLGDSFNQLLVHREFECILTDLMNVKNTIISYHVFQSNTFEVNGFTFTNNENKLKWIHDVYESMILDQLVQFIPAQYEPMVTDTDCVYLQKSIASDDFVDIKLQIRDLFPLVDFVKSHVIPIHMHNFESASDQEHELEMQRHRLHIIEETKLAESYQSRFCSISGNQLNAPQNELYPMQQDQIVEQNYLDFLREVYG